MVERECGFDIGECTVVVRGKAYLAMRWIWKASNNVADFKLVEIC